MVLKKGQTEEYDDQTKAMIEDILWNKTQDEKELKHLQGKLNNIKGYSDERTIQEYNKSFRENGLQPEGRDDYPYDQYLGFKSLREFDAKIDPDTLKKEISNMIIQPVTIKDKGKLVTKYALTVNGRYRGFSKAGVSIQRGWSDGWFYRPIIRFMVNSNEPFDVQTGQRIGEYRPAGKPEKIFTQYVPEDIKQRRALFEKILEDSDTLPEELNGKLMYRQGEGGQRGGAFTFDQFSDLEIDQLRQIQKNAYYTDTKGTLRNSEGAMVEYNRNTKKIEAIA
jgi:hypothetical protein